MNTDALPAGSWPVLVDGEGVEHPLPADDHGVVPGTEATPKVSLPRWVEHGGPAARELADLGWTVAAFPGETRHRAPDADTQPDTAPDTQADTQADTAPEGT